MEEANNKEMEYELDFLAAMGAYRKAKESNDPDAVREAEEALRTVVRNELTNE